MATFKNVSASVISALVASERRKRARASSAQLNFEYAVIHILQELWKASAIGPSHEVTIHKGSGWYSKSSRYRNPHLTYRTMMHAFNGLQRCSLIDVLKEGYYDHDLQSGKATKIKASRQLKEHFKNLPVHPAIALPPDLDRECIIMRNTVDGRRVTIDYEDTSRTVQWRENLNRINKCLIRHWPDLELTNKETSDLQKRLALDRDKVPVDLSKRTLVRIFSNNSWEQGGRFYRAWWQNVPKEFRPFITIDGKRTIECDYSQINPYMAYARAGAPIGSDDAYDRVLEKPHLRDIVKQAFNAMLQATTSLPSKPHNIDLDGTGLSWKDLKTAVLKSHEPIENLFFKGIGNHLQFDDSCMAEAVMLHFPSIDAPALPIHDSFIIHHGYGPELEEQMRKAFFNLYQHEVPEVVPIIRDRKPASDGWEDLSIEAILSGPKGYEDYTKRLQDWDHWRAG